MKKNLTPLESLNRMKLYMNYDSKKTLSENYKNINEQDMMDSSTYSVTPGEESKSDPKEWFKLVAKSYMNKPENIKTNFGSPSQKVKERVASFNKAISGLGRDDKGLEYIITNSFTNVADSIGFLKTYPEVNGESLYKAIEGEWYSDKLMNTVINVVSSQIAEWCSKNPKQSICQPKTKQQLQYKV